MKKFILGCASIITVGIFVACDNKKTVAEPVQDTEFQSTKDVTYANETAVEIAQIAGYMGEGQLTTSYLLPANGNTTQVTTAVLTGSHTQLTYNGTVTCRDGKKRTGIVDLFWASSPAANGANAFRDAGYVATIQLTNYSVDGWLIDDVGTFKITNTTAFGFTPASTNLKWTIEGKLIIDNTDDAKDMTWEGKFEQTLANTNNNSVFASTKLLPIAWSSTNIANCAKLEYTGMSSGVTGGSAAYTFSVTDMPLVRDFACSPDKVVAVNQTTASPGLIAITSEWHPFISGVASLTTSLAKDKAPRRIDYSNDGTASCDNAGKVTIKGVDTPVDFTK